MGLPLDGYIRVSRVGACDQSDRLSMSMIAAAAWRRESFPVSRTVMTARAGAAR